jgi:hypothetical protein
MMKTRWTLVLASLALSGCSHGGGEGPTLATAEGRLLKIAAAYSNATRHLNRAPKGLAEIQPYLEAGGDDVTRSPNDGEEFVILWGVEYNKLRPQREDPFTVAAYEKRGTGGKRFVLRIPTQVVQMTDAEFARAVFPPGQQPPK